MRSLHDLLPRFVDVGEPLRFLRQLLGDVSAAEHRFQVDPEVLNDQPVLNDLRRRRQLRHPLLDLWLERSVVPDSDRYTTRQMLHYVRSKVSEALN